MFNLRAMALAAALFAVNLLVGCSPKGAQPAAAPSTLANPAYLSNPVPPTAHGTSDQGGGGNLATEKQLSKDEISSVIKDLKYAVPPVLFRMEAYGVTYEQALKVYQEQKNPKPERSAKHLVSALAKMFANDGDAVYEALKKVKFTSLLDGACHDLKNEDKDGSAFNEDPKEICLSTSRLRSKVTHLTEQSEVLALALHELSHRLGADEDEAQAIQFMVLQQFGTATPEAFTSAYRGVLENPHWDLNSFRKNFLTKDIKEVPELCLRIGENFRDLDGFETKQSADANTLGVMFERPKTLRILRAALAQSLELQGFCAEQYHDTYMVSDAGFDPKKAFPVSALQAWDGQTTPLTLRPEDGVVEFVNQNDWDTAIFVFEQLVKSQQRFDEFSKLEIDYKSQ